jgi:AraC-like DNA-binding protein
MKQPSFDNWTIIFLFFAMLSFLLAIFFFLRKVPARYANRLLGIYMLLYGLTMVEYVLYWTGYQQQFTFLAGIYFIFSFAFGPLLLLYIKTVFGSKTGLAAALRHFALFAVLFVFSMLLGHVPGFSSKIFTKSGFSIFVSATVWVSIAHMFFYGACCLLYIRRQGSAGAVRQWSYWIVAFFLLYAAGNLAYCILVQFPFFNSQWDYFISFIMSGGILCTAWFGYAHPAIFQGFAIGQAITSPATVHLSEQLTFYNRTAAPYPVNNDKAASVPKYKNSGLTPAAVKKIAGKLENLVETHKIYGESDISLEKLAGMLSIGRHHLSQVINEHYKVNFFEYINNLRIEEAKKLLLYKTKQELNIIEVAYIVGFNNKVSFANAFKKVTGLTPTQYRGQKKG